MVAGAYLAHIKISKSDVLDSNNHRFHFKLSEKGESILGLIASPSILSLFGMVLIVCGVLFIDKDDVFPGWWALLPVLGSWLIIFSGPNTLIHRKFLSSRILVWIGLISFPLYLWHWPLLVVSKIVLGETDFKVRIIAVCLSLILAWFSYYFLEKIFRKDSFVKKKVSFLIILMLATACIGYAIYKTDGVEFRSVERAYSQLEGWNWNYKENETCKVRYKGNYQTFCIQNNDLSPTIILFGNGYANHLYPGGIHNSDLGHHTVLSFGSCDLKLGAGGDCKRIEKIIEGNDSVRYAFIALSWTRFNYSGRQVDMFSGREIESGAVVTEFIDGINKRIEFLNQKGIKVIVFGPKPEINFDALYCLSRLPFVEVKDCNVPLHRVELQQKKTLEMLAQVLKAHSNVKYFNQNSVFCNDECSLLLGGIPLLRDAGHLSEFGSATVIESFVEWAKLEVPDILY